MAGTVKATQRNGRQHHAEPLPALTGETVHGDGWQRQAEHLSLTHATVGAAAMAAAGQSRRRSSLKPLTSHLRTVDTEFERGFATGQIGLGDVSEQTSVKFAESVQYSARKTATAQRLIEDTETSTAPAAATKLDELADNGGSVRDGLVLHNNENRLSKTPLDLIVNETIRLSSGLMESDRAITDKGILEPKAKPGSVQEELVPWENENRSLQTSLDLLIKENCRLSRCLTESAAATADGRIAELEGELRAVRQALLHRDDENRSLRASLTAADKVRSQLEQKKAALLAAEIELNRVAAAVNETNEKRQREINALHACLEAISARATTAEKQIAELEGELRSVGRALLLREDKNRSLQASLTTADKVRTQLEQKKAALLAAEIELNNLISAVNETNEKRRSEIRTLHTNLEAMTARAITAERLLVEARQSRLMQMDEYSIAERKVADATGACDAVIKKFESLQNSLQAKERRVQELKQSRSKLIEGVLKSFTTPDTALACTEENIKFLAERLARLETEASNRAAPQRKLDDYDRQDGRSSEQVKASSTETLLAGTITL